MTRSILFFPLLFFATPFYPIHLVLDFISGPVVASFPILRRDLVVLLPRYSVILTPVIKAECAIMWLAIFALEPLEPVRSSINGFEVIQPLFETLSTC